MAETKPIFERPHPFMLVAGFVLVLAGLVSLVFGFSMDIALGTGLEYDGQDDFEVVNIDLMRSQLLFVVSGFSGVLLGGLLLVGRAILNAISPVDGDSE